MAEGELGCGGAEDVRRDRPGDEVRPYGGTEHR